MADVNERLVWAARDGDLGKVKLAWAEGANIHCDQEDALESAAAEGHYDIVEFLLDKGAIITPSLIGRRIENLTMAKLLLDRAPHLDLDADDGYLMKCAVNCDMRYAYHNGEKAISVLLDRGAKADVADNYALKMAAQRGDARMLELLFGHGVDVCAADNFALKLAVLAENKEIAQLLLEHGADIRAVQDKTSPTSWHKTNEKTTEMLNEWAKEKGIALEKPAVVNEEEKLYAEFVSHKQRLKKYHRPTDLGRTSGEREL